MNFSEGARQEKAAGPAVERLRQEESLPNTVLSTPDPDAALVFHEILSIHALTLSTVNIHRTCQLLIFISPTAIHSHFLCFLAV